MAFACYSNNAYQNVIYFIQERKKEKNKQTNQISMALQWLTADSLVRRGTQTKTLYLGIHKLTSVLPPAVGLCISLANNAGSPTPT